MQAPRTRRHTISWISKSIKHRRRFRAFAVDHGPHIGPVGHTFHNLTRFMSLRYVIAATAIIALTLSALTDVTKFVAHAQTADDDYAALEAFYDATNGDNWTRNDNWKIIEAYGFWYGVDDEILFGRVEALLLNGNNLDGELPAEIGDLTDLGGLYLHDNILSGPIPSEIGNLTNLLSLNLSNNSLTGAIPTEITQLTNLFDLNLSGNPGLCAPDSIQQWLIEHGNSIVSCENVIVDPVPIHGGDKAALEALYIATDGSEWANNTNWVSDQPLNAWFGVSTDTNGRVIGINLEDNEVDGEIPTILGNLTELRVLNLSGNRLNGQIPTSIGNLAKLTRLVLSTNSLDGQIPANIVRLGNLQFLLLNNNDLTGEIPTELLSLSNLNLTQGLDLRNNPGLCAPEELLSWLTERNNDVASCDKLDEQFAQNYAPILRMHPGETVFPSAVEVMMANSILRDGEGVQVTNHPPQVTSEYLGDFFFSVHDNHYLDLASEAPFWYDDRDDADPYAEYNAAAAAIEYDLDNDAQTPPDQPEDLYTVYTRLDIQDNILGLQYWFFYPLDRNHEGDWEMIQLEFDSDMTNRRDAQDVNALLASIVRNRIEPNRVVYSSHQSVNSDCWRANSSLGREGNQVYVYPALGSHANYFETGSHPFVDLLGTSNDLIDVANATGTSLVPDGYTGSLSNVANYELVVLDTSSDAHPWIDFRGKWGEQTGRSALGVLVIGDGPSGPKFSDRWRIDDGIHKPTSDCINGKTLNAETGTQSIGNNLVRLDVDDDAEGEVTLEFSYDALDAIRPGLEIQIGSADDASDIVGLSAVLAIQGVVDVVDVVMYDVSLNQDLGETTTLCIKEPASFPLLTELQLWHFDSETLQWNKLNTNVVTIDGEKFACGETTSFSFFALTAINPVLAGSAGAPKLASHIQPNVTSITLSPSDTVRLSTNIFGQQDILDKSLAENLTFEWDLDGTTIDGDGHEIEFTAPESPGRYTVTATLPDTECNAKHGSCSAEFNIRVRRPRSVDPAVDVSEPVNPAGQIPIVIPGADGTQHAVFTPVEGGSVKSGSCTFEAPSGAINDNEFIGIAVQTTDDPTQLIPVDDPRFVTQDSQCNLSAIDNAGTIADYRLRVPGDVCIPVPDEYRSNAFDIRLLSIDNDQTQILATRVIINDPEIPLKLCGKLSTLPNTVFAALPANLAPKIPTPEIVGDEVTTPDTGPSAIPPMATWFILVLGIALLVFVTTVKLKNHNFRRSRR